MSAAPIMLATPAAPMPPVLAALTRARLIAAAGCQAAPADRWHEPLRAACARFAIHNPARLAAFLAQVGHESASLAHAVEIWGPTPAQQRYEGRADLGNTAAGDGSRYRGRGLIQTTGRANYVATRDALRAAGLADCPDFVADPAALAMPPWGALSAAWYWASRGCNELADAGRFEAITRRINGGLNGQPDRVLRHERARRALGIA